MDSLGPEALFQASRECKFRLVRLLVDGGTLANVRNENQETPLILACMSESEEKEKVVEYLIRQRVKVNLQDINGKTALIHACLTNSCDNVIRMLVNSKANPWLVDESKNTAFDYAINAGNIGAVKLMIQACREGKILTKPGSFNMEMRKLEDRLDQMPETRKCSWPLMGPRNSAGKEKKVVNQSSLLAVKEADEVIETPTRERRRKRSICHFDPIEIDAGDEVAEADYTTKILRKSSLHSASRSASEDERISLHFSDSDNSSFDRSSANFSSLEKLLRLRDSVTSSVESNESVNAQNSQSAVLTVEGAWNKGKELQKNSPPKTGQEMVNDIAACIHYIESVTDDVPTIEIKESRILSTKENNGATPAEKPSHCHFHLKSRNEKEACTEESKSEGNDFYAGNRRRKPLKHNEGKIDSSGQTTDVYIESPCFLPYGTGRKPFSSSPRVPRRRTIGSLATSQQTDVTDDWELKRFGNEAEATRRFTVGALDDRRKSPNLWGDEHGYRPSPPPKDFLSLSSRKPITVVTSHENEATHFNVSSPEMKLFKKRIRSPEVDFVHNNTCSTEQELNRKFENTSIQNSPDTMRSRKHESSKSEVKTNIFMPINLPIISPPENTENNENEKMDSGKNIQVEKATVRRTLSDSVSQERRRACAMDTIQDLQGNNREGKSNEKWTSACVEDLTAATAPASTRERSASFTPLTTISTPPQEHKSYIFSNVTCCDIVTMATSSTGGESPRSRSPRNKLSSDLPDLVLHAPRSRGRSPNNLDPFSLTPELQVTDFTHTRFTRSSHSSSEILSPGAQAYLTENYTCVSKTTSTYNHLPEVVSSTTGSPRERRAAFLPPLNISRKTTESEDGYFSCSPSPLDLESPNRSKDKSKYSFKPLSPRLMNRSVKNLLP